MHTDLAISFAMEKVVVVVVVTILDGSLGSGIRFDWENLSDPRFVIASSVVNVCSILVNRTRCDVSGKLTMRVENRSLKSCSEHCKPFVRVVNAKRTQQSKQMRQVVGGLFSSLMLKTKWCNTAAFQGPWSQMDGH